MGADRVVVLLAVNGRKICGAASAEAGPSLLDTRRQPGADRKRAGTAGRPQGGSRLFYSRAQLPSAHAACFADLSAPNGPTPGGPATALQTAVQGRPA